VVRILKKNLCETQCTLYFTKILCEVCGYDNIWSKFIEQIATWLHQIELMLCYERQFVHFIVLGF
jgi:hypothetical protein